MGAQATSKALASRGDEAIPLLLKLVEDRFEDRNPVCIESVLIVWLLEEFQYLH